jgi:predicted O-methyltransferase YrrM
LKFSARQLSVNPQTAALLSWAAGQDSVTTIEVDPGVADQAAANLRAAGASPQSVTSYA